MPLGTGPSVNHSGGCDYWRTWFIEECEESQLFGVTEKHLGLLAHDGIGIPSYRVGTKIYLEDAPFFRGSKTYHRVCGPYEVFSLPQIPDGAEHIHVINGNVIVFKVPHPELGPWHNRNNKKRDICGISIKFRQVANEYNYFPYRFAIRKSKNFDSRLIPHNPKNCWLCK